MPAAVRIGDSISCGDAMSEGSGNVFAEGISMSRKDPVDHTKGHCYSPTTIQDASPDVFINVDNGGAAAVRLNDPIIPHCCCSIPATHGGKVITGASHVFINSIEGPGALIDENDPLVTLGPSPPNVNPSPALDITSADVHIYEKNDIPDDTNPPPANTQTAPMYEEAADATPPPDVVPPVQDCSDVNDLPDDFTWADKFSSFGEFAASFALSPNFTVATLCYCAVSSYTFSASINQASGLTQKQILSNMCHHAKTVLEPLVSAYGDFTITSGFRNKSGTSQHNIGQATDLQFMAFHGKVDTADSYFETSKEIRDGVNFDQMILEYFGRNPWIHISSNPSGHRHIILTQIQTNSYASGLKLLRRTAA